MLDREGHLTECALLSYLAGDVDEAEASTLEEHVGACPTCAVRLQEEAQFEAVLYDAAEQLGDNIVPLRRRWERVAVAATAMLAMAAALVLAVADPGQWVDPAPSTAVAVAPAPGLNEELAAFENSVPAICLATFAGDENCDDAVALATFPEEAATFDPFADTPQLCEANEDTSGPICLDG